ncbi:hypothetical protein [Streptomyces sp. NPDC046939]|uniref:hypothetical protein n=1 Tax=Streptomyces sp. NPDC046939 TaxID=3155376 RepID=UPI0033FCDCEC
MDAIGAEQAIDILESHAIVPRDDRQRDELFAAFAWLRINAIPEIDTTYENP